MDFWTNCKKIFMDTAQTVAKKTEEVVETSKTKYSIYDAKNDIQRFTQI